MNNSTLKQILKTRGYKNIKIFTITVVNNQAHITTNDYFNCGYNHNELIINILGILNVNKVYLSIV